MLARLSAFVIWALLAGSAVFWVFRLAVHPAPAPAHSIALSDANVAGGDLSRLLGVPPVAPAPAVAAAPEAASRFRLLGIVAPKRARTNAQSHGGVALIAIDGKPARAFRVGARVDGDLVLQSVSLRTASVGPAQGAQTIVLQVPPLAAPATGPLPPAGSGAPVSPAPAAVPVAPAPAMVPQPLVAPPPAVLHGPVSRDGGALTQ